MFCVVVDKVHSLVCIRQVISWLDVGNPHQCLITQITQSPAFLKGKSHIKIMCAWSPVRHYQWTELHCFLNVGRMSLVWWSFTEPIILPLLILHGHWCITISQRKWKNQPTQLAVFPQKWWNSCGSMKIDLFIASTWMCRSKRPSTYTNCCTEETSLS